MTPQKNLDNDVPVPKAEELKRVLVPEVEEPRKRINDKMVSHLLTSYLLIMIAFLAWQLFDTWIGNYSLLKPLGYGLQRQSSLRLIAFTLIAGALGGVVNGLRSALEYNDRFDRKHAWKYLCAPWMGATLALFVYALLRSSIATLGGNPAGNFGSAQVLSNFSAGALVGYGSKDVFVWLDRKVENLFKADPGESGRAHDIATAPPKQRQRVRKMNQAPSRKQLAHRQESAPAAVSHISRA